MSNTVKQLGFIPTNRGEFDTTGQTKYYKDNVVQYRNGSYICSPVGYSTSNPTAYTTDAPYQDGDTQLNPNWKLMASVGLVDEEPTASSDNLVKSGGVQNELALGAVYDVSAKNPTGGPNNDGKWESLSALLSDANLSTLIPTSVRKGGMSIKFVQSSDNKYVHYNLLFQSFTTDITQWAIVDDAIYIENSEFAAVWRDADKKIIIGIRKNGDVYFGTDVPQQVIDYIKVKIKESDTILKNLIDEIDNSKLDANGLTPEALNALKVVNNDEWSEITREKNGKIIEGITSDGRKKINIKTIINGVDITEKIQEHSQKLEALTSEQIFGFNHWKNKKACVIGASGTSVGYNTQSSWPQLTAEKLGINLRHCGASGGSAPGVRYLQVTNISDNTTYAGVSATKSEFNALGQSWQNRSWEDLFTTDLDLFIFGEMDSKSFNDSVVIDGKTYYGGTELIDLLVLPSRIGTEEVHLTYSDGVSLENRRDTYIGALIYLLDKLWSINPTCRVCFTHDYLYYTGVNGSTLIVREREGVKMLCEKLCISNVELYKTLCFNAYTKGNGSTDEYNNPNVFLYDGVHPSIYGRRIISNIFTHKLLLIS